MAFDRTQILKSAIQAVDQQKPGEFQIAFNQLMHDRVINTLNSYRAEYNGRGYTNNAE